LDFLAELRRRSVFRVTAAYLVAAWVVMQVVGFVADASTMPEWATTFVLILVIAGLPIVIVVAWAFEITPEGPKLTGPRGEDERIKPFRPADAILVAALVAVICVVVWQQLAPRDVQYVAAEVEQDAGPEAASIAVLAFDDLSPEGNQEYFSDGISEELLNVLVRVDGLRVASRTSAFSFKGSDASIPEIASDLNVRHVVEGSVRRAGDTIRITAQLIDSESDGHMWSETYDRELTASNIFAVQDEIATAIVAELRARLGGILPEVEIDVTAATDSLDAFELYWRAWELYLDRRDLGEVERLLAQVVDLDPEYAEAWELRGATHMLAGVQYGGIPGTRDELLAMAREYNDIALALDPDSSLAIASNANLSVDVLANPDAAMLAQAIEDLTRAIELDPHNVSALNWRGGEYLRVGYDQLAIQDYLACIELEPLSAACQGSLINTYSTMGEYQLAYDRLIESLEQGVAYVGASPVSLAILGKRDLFLVTVAQDYPDNPPWGTPDVFYEILRNPEGDWDHLIPAFEAQWDNNIAYRYLGPIIGAYPSEFPDGWYAFYDHEYAEYRRSPEYQAQLQASSLPEFWRAYGFPPQCRERDDGWIECE